VQRQVLVVADEPERVDRLLQRMMVADRVGDIELLRTLASQLGRWHESLSAWSHYVLAGCAATSAEPETGLELLRQSLDSGEWWGPALLDDPALAPIWPLAGAEDVRSESLRRWREELAGSAPQWEVVEAGAPTAVALVLHGGGISPPDLYRSVWAGVQDVALVLVRSSHPQAAGVWDWADRARALRDVSAAATAARERFGTELPLVPAGLGAGARVAIDAALHLVPGAAGAVAVAPALDQLLATLEREEPVGARGRYWITTGGLDAAVRSVDAFAAWAAAHSLACHVDRRADLGHEYPPDAWETLSAAIRWVVSCDARQP